MRTIQQTIEIPGASAAELFEIFMDSEKHSELIGAEARVHREDGGAFSLFDGAVRGTNLLVVPNRLTVKSWRGSVWHDGDLDSIEVMTFEDTDRGARINLVQTALPDQFVERWNDLYWIPLRMRFEGREERDVR